MWLKQRLKTSDTTWKIIVSNIPMSIPTGKPTTHDGWADFLQDTGFEHELVEILRYIQENTIDNTVWITTDVHFAPVFRYTPFLDNPSFHVYEFITGPLNAVVGAGRNFDATLNPRRLFLRALKYRSYIQLPGGDQLLQFRHYPCAAGRAPHRADHQCQR